MAQPLISIITVVYNGAATLEKTIQTVLAQTYDSFEYIIVDGGSTDGTLAILDTYRAHIAKYVSEPDKGVYDAMNKGIRMASGHWLFFLGADDILYDNEVLASVAGALGDGPLAPPPDLLYGNVVSPSYKGIYDGQFTFEKLLSKNISHQAIFYKRQLFDRIGNYNLHYKAYADWAFNIRCFADQGIRTAYLDRVVAEFGEGGISSRHDVPFLREVLIPEKLRLLSKNGPRRLRNLPTYDEWWRLVRNAGIRRAEELDELARLAAPAGLKRMARWQSRISPQSLRIGILSKCLMFASYLVNLLTGAI
jgi:glycosyltransferase involved in cell wall biosynthesis